jgi:hypothetical protein
VDETQEYELANSKGRPWMTHPDSPFECDACGDGDALWPDDAECAYCDKNKEDYH